MPMDVEASALAFFVRTSQNLKILTLGKASVANQEKLNPKELAKLPHIPKSASWSPDSQCLAVGDTVKGVVIIGLRKGKPTVQILQGSSTNTQHIWWSPSSKFLVTQNPPEKVEKGETAPPNLLVWNAETLKIEAQFSVPKGDGSSKKACPLLWAPDESVCARILPPEKNCRESVLHLLPGHDLNATPLFEIREERANLVAQWAPASAKTAATPKNAGLQLALFVSDGRNEMQRVSSPAEIRIYDCTKAAGSTKLVLSKRAESASGESADLQWSASGDALLALVETEVDETGVSYYGSTRLLLLPNDPDAEVQELNKDADGKYQPIQAVSWSPAEDLFVLIRGFQPANVSLWKYDRLTKQAKCLTILADKAHRNSVKWNKFGSVCLIGGFGNLAGELDFFGKTDTDKLEKMATSQANCTVSVEWSADGIHIITAVLAPRMRVGNGFTIWNCLTGAGRHTEPFEELYEVGIRPHDCKGSHFEGPQRQDIKKAAAACSKTTEEKPKKAAYRPPHARGEPANNSIKAFMLGQTGDASSPRSNSPDKKSPDGKKALLAASGAKAGNIKDAAKQEQDGSSGGATGVASGKEESGNSSSEPSGRTDKAWIRGQAVPSGKKKEEKANKTGAGDSATTSTSAEQPANGGADVPPARRSQNGVDPEKTPSNSRPQSDDERGDSKLQNKAGAKGFSGAETANGKPGQPATSSSSSKGGALAATENGGKQQNSSTGLPPPPSHQPPTTAAMAQQQAANDPKNSSIPLRTVGAGGPPTAQPPGASKGPPGAPPSQFAPNARGPPPTMNGPYPGMPGGPPMKGYPNYPGAPPPSYPHGMIPGPPPGPPYNGYGAGAPGYPGAGGVPPGQYPPHFAHHPGAPPFPHHPPNMGHYGMPNGGKDAGKGGPGPLRDNRPCPTNGWQYVDPKGNVQGPFELEEMLQWHQLGYFKPELKMRFTDDMEFLPFSVLWKHPAEPFESFPNVPASSYRR
ncbi:unnamed protein product [Amoebophrya sp. A120]|nr:unnamed protein product [Amoebophrya sp. A120]|eukprot:GSA120T00016644001.1